MPTGDINYKNSVIYKFHCKNPEVKEVYIGSTSNFRGRKSQHKKSCNNPKSKKYNLPVYKFIRDNDGWDNWYMTQLYAFPCENKRELETEERRCIEEYGFNNCLNCIIPTRSQKEWREDNKVELSEYYKEWYEDNKEKLLEKKKEYYEKNKEKIKEQRSKPITCICGSTTNSRHKARHEKTIKHQTYINSL